MEIQDILSYLRIIRKWWWVIVALVGTTIGTMLAIAFLTETEYEATVTVQVSAPPPQEVPLYSSFGREALNDEIAQTQASFSEFLLGGDVAWRALEALPDVPINGRDLKENIVVDIPENSQLMRVSVPAADPDTAALLANTLVEIGLEQYGQLLARPTANTLNFIEQELEVARTELTSAETELTQFRIINKLGDLNDAITNQYNLIRSLTMQQALAQADGETARAEALGEIILEHEVGLQNMIGLSAEYNELTDHVGRARNTYNFLLDKQAEAQIKENQIRSLGSIQVITPARPPENPASIINGKIIVLGVIASLMAGILLAFLLEYMDISGTFQRSRMRRREPSEMVLSENVS